jgi:hypothetical protein
VNAVLRKLNLRASVRELQATRIRLSTAVQGLAETFGQTAPDITEETTK